MQKKIFVGIIIIVAVAIIAIGGVFAYQYFAKPQTSATNVQSNQSSQNSSNETVVQPNSNVQNLNNQTVIPVVNSKEQACKNSGGTVSTETCYCSSAQDFYNSCEIGACSCNPALGISRELRVCDCGPQKCFNGSECVPLNI